MTPLSLLDEIPTDLRDQLPRDLRLTLALLSRGRVHRVPLAGYLSGPERVARNRAMMEEHASGVSYETLAERYGMTPDRVRRIVTRHGCHA